MAKCLQNVEIGQPTGECYSMSTVNYQYRTSTPLSSIAPTPLDSTAKYEDETAVCGGLYVVTLT